MDASTQMDYEQTVVTYGSNDVSVRLCAKHDTEGMRAHYCLGATNPSVSYGQHRGVCDECSALYVGKGSEVAS